MATSYPSNPTQDELIGRTLGDYRLQRILATGGMARIYEAEDLRLGRPAAVKVLTRERLELDPTLTQRFQREARAIANLDHPNIVTLFQYGEQDDVYFLAMQLIRGKDLAQEFARYRRDGKRIEVPRILSLLAQVAAALDHAHEHNVIHRDVKPSNILIDRSDKAILTDFGLVMQQSIDATMGTAFGTPRYIAPEQAIASSRAVPQSDIYALGIILYEALCGETPFSGGSPMEIALMHVNDAPPPPRDHNPAIPPDAESALLRALDKDPARRFRTATDFINAVRSAYGIAPDPTNPTLVERRVIEQDLSATAAAASWDIEPQPAARRPQPRTLVIGILALVLVIGAVIAGIVLGQGGGGTSTTRGGSAQTGALATENPNGAPIRLLYDENGFALVNDGDYTINVLRLQFIRGDDGGGDDYAGDRITRDAVPPHNCARVEMQNRVSAVPQNCAQTSHVEYLQNIDRFFWRREPADAPTFEVWYDRQVIARCDTVRRGDALKTCSFRWGVSAERAAMGD